MSRGNTVANLLLMLKAEVGEFSGTNPTRDAEMVTLLSNMQKRLVTEHYWPFLEQMWDVSVPAGQQFVGLPTVTAGNPATETVDIDLDRIPTVKTLYSTLYWPVQYGISELEYNVLNYSLGQSSDPIQRWRLATNPNEPNNPNQFEVWPVPTTDQTLRFTGKRAIQVLSAPTDTADLDDMLIVLFVSSEMLARASQPDARIKLEAAVRRLQWLKQGQTTKDRVLTLDGAREDRFRKDKHTIGVAVAQQGAVIGIG